MVFDFDSGHLALDFANTMNWHASDEPQEYLNRYRDLLEWGRQAGLLTSAQIAELELGGGAELESARELREALYRIFRDHATGVSPGPDDLDLLADHYQTAISHGRMVSGDNRYRWTWDQAGLDPERVIWPVAQAAVELLFSDELDRVGQCADDRGCGWLFIDTSRNRSRRWCSMESCGNRAKARRYYRRTKNGGNGGRGAD